jgi:hypothetical protein
MIPTNFLSVLALLFVFSSTVIVVIEITGDFFVSFARMVVGGISGQLGGSQSDD